MANISQLAGKAMLDWVLGGAAATPPASRCIGLSLGNPSSTSMSEVGTASGYTASSMAFGAAITAGTVANSTATASNASAATFGPFSTAQSISGIFVKDTSATAGAFWFYGALATARTVSPGDSLIVAQGALTITLV
jgi:hypothetical protein